MYVALLTLTIPEIQLYETLCRQIEFKLRSEIPS